MICVVVGLVPPDECVAKNIRKNVTSVEEVDDDDDDTSTTVAAIEWRQQHSLARDIEDKPDSTNDDEETGVLTLLLTAIIVDDPVRPEMVVEAIQNYLSTQHPSSKIEMWASAGAPLPLRPLQGYEPYICVPSSVSVSSSLSSNGHIVQAVQAMQEWGLVLQRNVLTSIQIAKFRRLVDRTIQHIETQLQQHRPNLTIGQDNFCFQEIASRNQQRFDLRLDQPLQNGSGDDDDDDDAATDLVQELVRESPQIQSFLKLAMNLPQDTMMPSLLDVVDFDLSVVYSKPGACAQGWHADGTHSIGAPDAGWSYEGWKQQLAPPYAICLFIPLIDLNESVGYTQFWPGSHRSRQLLGLGPVARVTQSVWNSSNCRAGDGIWYDYRLMHQGMPHAAESSIAIRPVLQIIFKQKWYIEKANYGKESIKN